MREWVIDTTGTVYMFLMPISWIALAIVLFVLLPLAAWRKTRGFSAIGLYVTSYIFGATTWFLGAAITFASFGWLGLIIGLLVLGVGVVPLGIVGAFFKLDMTGFAVSLCVMLAITLATRFAAVHFAAKADA